MNYSEAVSRRRSLRNYVRTEISKDHLDFLLNLICCDNDELQRQTLCTTFIADRIQGLTSGSYLLNQATRSVALIREGSLTELMAHICLDQKWLAHTSLNVCFTTNLDRLDTLWGARGYRYAMISAGRLAQRLYLGATAIGIGSCGIGAFYDNEASEIADLNDASAMLYLMAIGSVKRVRN
jgi:SagB-type dehydrogenase family enzyme